MRDRTGQVWVVRPNDNVNDHWIFVVTGPSTHVPRNSFYRHPILYVQGSSDQANVTSNGEAIGSDTCWEENESYSRVL